MLELTTDNLIPYLRERGWLNGDARVELLTGGVSNVVYRVCTPSGDFVVEQSRPQLRTRADWFSDINRIFRELEVMQALAPILPGVVPRVLHIDRDNYAFAMSAAPEVARSWKSLLLEGSVRPDLASDVGRVLGRMHQASAEQAERFRSFSDPTVFVQLRVDPFYRRVQERQPEVAAQVQDLIDQMLSRREALCHGDYTPKNMLVHDGGFTLVDYETAYFGDPTMDLGLLMCHLLLKVLKLAAVGASAAADRLFQFAGEVWCGYTEEVRFRPLAELEARGVAHCGACLLARVDGTSPVDYLDEAQRERVRQLGRRVLLERVSRWDEVVEMVTAG